ncbi:tetratricopeptide repeat protein [Streptomyces sp. NPDC059355]|uniref:tetratricopeptide repeat protein n=1 Tax=Streptomyces sp. NPDC059355 TaxID=3346811 RepID=UPI0036BD5AA5
MSAGTGGVDLAEIWRVGDVIEGRYEVLPADGHGDRDGEADGDGDGVLLYRVRHLDWGIDLAVRSPRPRLMQNDGARERFAEGAGQWLGISPHPHVCCCHHVSTIGGVPRIFAEYVTGGSLREWIDDGRLYAGGPERATARILDLAVQIAWGLGHSHGQGVLHRNVKPANVLISTSGDGPAPVAKVTGFGRVPGHATGQRHGSSRSDWVGFADSVVEMFDGGATWMPGSAGAALHTPKSLAGLLERCLRGDPADPPRSMNEVAHDLMRTYAEFTGHTYPRAWPAAIALRADELNNRALSLLDLGRPDEAENAFTAALAADPRHRQANYNTGLLAWRRGDLTDEGLLAALARVREGSDDPPAVDLLSALVHLERGDMPSASALLERTTRERPDGPEARQARRVLASRGAADARCVARWDLPWQTFPAGKTPPDHDLRTTPDFRLAVCGAADHTVRVWDTRTGAQVKALTGHTGQVDSADISADGRYAVSAGRDRTVRLWDLAQGRLVRTVGITRWEDGEGPVNARRHDRRNERNERAGRPFVVVHRARPDALVLNIAASPVRLDADGSTAVWAEADGRIQVWDLLAGRHLATLPGKSGGAQVAVSADGRRVLGGNGTASAVLRLWDLTTGECVRRWDEYPGGVRQIWFGQRGDRAVVLGRDKVFRLWDLFSGRCVRLLRLPSDFHVRSAALDADDGSLLVGGWDGSVMWWDLDRGRCVRTFRGHEEPVTAVRFAPDGRHAFSASLDGTARQWLLPRGFTAPLQLGRPGRYAELGSLEQELKGLTAAAEEAATAGRTAEALELLGRARTLPGCARAPRVLSALRSLGPRTERTGLRDAWAARTLPARTGEYRDIVSGRAVDLTRDAALGVYGDVDKRIQVWDLASGTRLRVIETGGRPLETLRLSADGTRVVSGSASGIQTWSVSSGRCLSTLPVGRGNGIRVAIDPAARLAMAVNRVTATMTLWDLCEGRRLRVLPMPERLVTSLAFDAAGRRVVTAGDDKVARLWDLDSGECVRAVRIESALTAKVCPSPDGTLIVAAEAVRSGEELHGRIRVWDTSGGEQVRTFETHPRQASHLRFSADGRHLLTGGTGSAARVWDVATGRCLRILDGHMKTVTALAVTPDAGFVLTADRDESLRLWELDWDRAPRT